MNPAPHVHYARLHTDWEQCACGSSFVMQWGTHEVLGDLAAPVVTGLSLDRVLGGHTPATPDLSFDTFFRHQNLWGLSPSALGALLRPDVFAGVVPSLRQQMQDTYTGYSDVEWQRAWSFSLYHRQRLQLASEAWRLSFTVWPIVPAVDKALIEIGGGLPPSSAAKRRAQYELLRRRFPALAALPLDRNSLDTTPLAPSLGWRLQQAVLRPVRRVRDALERRGWRAPERRRYYRIYDINGPGWTELRRQAEPCRDMAYGFFEKKALDELLPPPGVPVPARDGIYDVAGTKVVIAFLLWARDHLP
jgi:asparagine synthase (glutamine-hydrolysing)